MLRSQLCVTSSVVQVKVKVSVPEKGVQTITLKESNIQELLPAVRQTFDISKAYQLKFSYKSAKGEIVIK